MRHIVKISCLTLIVQTSSRPRDRRTGPASASNPGGAGPASARPTLRGAAGDPGGTDRRRNRGGSHRGAAHPQGDRGQPARRHRPLRGACPHRGGAGERGRRTVAHRPPRDRDRHARPSALRGCNWAVSRPTGASASAPERELGGRVPTVDLLDRRLLFVTGKGGVSRTTVSAALGLVAAAQGRRTLVCEVDAKGSVAARGEPRGRLAGPSSGARPG